MALAFTISLPLFLAGWRLGGTPVRTGHSLLPRQLTLAGLPFLAIPAALSTFLAVRAYGGIIPFLNSEATLFSMVGQEAYSPFTLLTCSFVPLLACILISKQREPSSAIHNILLAIGGITYGLLLARMGTRTYMLFAILGLGGIWLSAQREVLRARVVLAGIAGVAALLLFAQVRGSLALNPQYGRQAIRTIQQMELEVVVDGLLAGDLDAYANGTHVFDIIPSRQPMLWGVTFLSVVYNPIPRAFWVSKPAPGMSALLARYRLGSGRIRPDTNFACSLIAEFYANFWWVGVFLGPLLYGTIAARFWQRFLACGSSSPEAWMHAGLFGAYLCLVQRGAFHTFTVYYLMFLANVYSVAWLARRRTETHMKAAGCGATAQSPHRSPSRGRGYAR